jgi:hypothetical protein
MLHIKSTVTAMMNTFDRFIGELDRSKELAVNSKIH